ncbi:hypothetical protein ETH_00003030, partial [Eimeria tenella]
MKALRGPQVSGALLQTWLGGPPARFASAAARVYPSYELTGPPPAAASCPAAAAAAAAACRWSGRASPSLRPSSVAAPAAASAAVPAAASAGSSRCSSTSCRASSAADADAQLALEQQQQQQQLLQLQQQWLRSTPESHVLAKQPLRARTAAAAAAEDELLLTPADCLNFFKLHQGTLRPERYLLLLQQLQQALHQDADSSSSSSSSWRRCIDEVDVVALQKWLLLRVDTIPARLLLRCLLQLDQLAMCSRLLLHAAAPLLLLQLPQLRLQGALQLLQLY